MLRSFISLLLLLSLTTCQASQVRPAPAPPIAQPGGGTPGAGPAQLSIIADPPGAQVEVDGQIAGTSPLTLTLPAGAHQVGIGAPGYAAISEPITLTAGQQGIYSPALDDVAPPQVTINASPNPLPPAGRTQVRVAATDNRGVTEVQVLAGGQLLAESQNRELAVEVAPGQLGSLPPDGVYTLTAVALDAAGNEGQAILRLAAGGPADRASPSAPASPAPTTPQPVATARATPTRPAATATPAAGPQPVTPVPSSPTATAAVRPGIAAPTAAPAGVTGNPAGGAGAAPTPDPLAGKTSYSVGSIVIPTYPYTRYLRTVADPKVLDYPVLVFDRAAYEASQPRPVPVKYTLITLENRYLRLTVLPDLGGRIYQVVFKPTGNNEFYQNPVIKPSGWGPPASDYPAGANWWLGAGGLEWGFPVEEHGYEWGKPWGYDFFQNDDGSVTATVFMQDYRRPYVSVAITLPPDSAAFTVQPRIVNPLGAAFRFKWWANAMLAPGPANKPGPDLLFIIPGSEVTVHSAGDQGLPQAGQAMSWPVYNGRDYSRLGNWGSWLGFFARPAAQAAFAGVYDVAANEGIVRTFPPDVARGVKAFATGWAQPVDPGNWTDDGSGYVELHGGLTPTFDEWNELPPGGQVGWTETWYPAAGIGGVSYASEAGAVYLAHVAGDTLAGFFPTRSLTGTVEIAPSSTATISKKVTLDPAHPYFERIPGVKAGGGPVTIKFIDDSGAVLIGYQEMVR